MAAKSDPECGMIMTGFGLIRKIKSLICYHREKNDVYKHKNSRTNFFTVSATLLYDLLSVSKKKTPLVQNVKGRN